MAELKAAPLFGSVRLQRLTRGYTTARTTPVSPAASASAAFIAAFSVASSPLPRFSESHRLPRRDGTHAFTTFTVFTGVPRAARIKSTGRWCGARRVCGSSSPPPGKRPPSTGTGPSIGAGTGAG
ncbi:hypothetical protein ALC53_00156 [Atta colombica]|uniref:Uncharacterized protein n=1 Tax=Atta colombica TaxID=520822 RepID=A0A195BY44_9HYME|nr:hypothetical protein ALC53_00156 [Atta colombica]